MTAEEIVKLMNKYVDMKSQIALLEADKKKLIDDAMPQEIRDQVAEIEEEFEGKNENAQRDLASLEEQIKTGVVSLQKSLVVEGLKASYHAGRVSWDAKGLENILKKNPEVASAILPFKKQGKDYASFRFE